MIVLRITQLSEALRITQIAASAVLKIKGAIFCYSVLVRSSKTCQLKHHSLIKSDATFTKWKLFAGHMLQPTKNSENVLFQKANMCDLRHIPTAYV